MNPEENPEIDKSPSLLFSVTCYTFIGSMLAWIAKDVFTDSTGETTLLPIALIISFFLIAGAFVIPTTINIVKYRRAYRRTIAAIDSPREKEIRIGEFLIALSRKEEALRYELEKLEAEARAARRYKTRRNHAKA